MKTRSHQPAFDMACERFTREVRSRPLLSLGLALGAGALLVAVRRSAAGRGRSHYATLVSDLEDHAHAAGNRVLRGTRQARREVHSAVRRAAAVAEPVVDLEALVRHGRRWLRKKLA